MNGTRSGHRNCLQALLGVLRAKSPWLLTAERSGNSTARPAVPEATAPRGPALALAADLTETHFSSHEGSEAEAPWLKESNSVFTIMRGFSVWVTNDALSVTPGNYGSVSPMCSRRNCRNSILHFYVLWEMTTASSSQDKQPNLRQRSMLLTIQIVKYFLLGVGILVQYIVNLL